MLDGILAYNGHTRRANTTHRQNRFVRKLCALNAPPAGLEPAIFGLEVRRLVPYAKGARQNVQVSV